MLLGCLLRVSPDQDGGGKHGEDGLPDPVWGCTAIHACRSDCANMGATFQRLMHITLGPQLGKNVEAYVDDIVVKSSEAKTLIQNLEETFASLNAVSLRLNPEKCVFGVPSGKLLGFLVSHRGIEANPKKVKAVEDMSPPKTLREMQKLTGRVTVLGRFISRLGERALPFF